MAVLGDSVTLECSVSAHPEPKMLFWRDPKGRVPVIQGGANHIDIQKSKDVSKENIQYSGPRAKSTKLPNACIAI